MSVAEKTKRGRSGSSLSLSDVKLMLKRGRKGLNRGTRPSPVRWKQSTEHRTGAMVSPHEGSEGGRYGFVPLRHGVPKLRPGRDSVSQVRGNNASSGNRRNRINLGKNAKLMQAPKCTEMKQGSAEPASREAQRHSLSLPS